MLSSILTHTDRGQVCTAACWAGRSSAGVAGRVSAMCGAWGVGRIASRPRPPGPRSNFPSEKVLLTIKYLSQQGRPWLPWPMTSKKRKIKGNPGGRGREQEDRAPGEIPFSGQQFPLEWGPGLGAQCFHQTKPVRAHRYTLPSVQLHFPCPWPLPKNCPNPAW